MQNTMPDLVRTLLLFSLTTIACSLLSEPSHGFQKISRHEQTPSTFENMEVIAMEIRQAQMHLVESLKSNPDAPPHKFSKDILDKYLAADIPAAVVANAELELFKFHNKIEGHDLKNAAAKLSSSLGQSPKYPRSYVALAKTLVAQDKKSDAKHYFEQAYEIDPCQFAHLLEPDSPKQNFALIRTAEARITRLMNKQHLTNFRLLDVADGIYQLGLNSKDATLAIELFDQLFVSRSKTMARHLRSHAKELQNRLYLKQAKHLTKTGADTTTQLAMIKNARNGNRLIDEARFAVARIFMRGGRDAELAGKIYDPIAEYEKNPAQVDQATLQLLVDHATEQNDFEAITRYLGRHVKHAQWRDSSDDYAMQYVKACLEIEPLDTSILEDLQKYLDAKALNKKYTPGPEFLHASGQLAMKVENYSAAAGFYEKVLAQNAQDKKALAAIIACYENFLKPKK